ncbi:MAG: helix-turn-helix transcriptional regulator [Bacteroidota bacterium]
MLEVDFTMPEFQKTNHVDLEWIKNGQTEGNLIYFDDKMSKGVFFHKELEDGIVLKIWDYMMHDDTKIRIKPVTSGEPIIYIFDYILTPETYLIATYDLSFEKKHKVTALSNSIFHTNHSNEFSYILKRGRRARCINIIFTHEWLLSQFNSPQKEEMLKLLSTGKGFKDVYFEPLSAINYQTVNDFFEKVFKNDWDIIFLKAGVMTLLNKALNNSVWNKKNAKDYSISTHTYTMMEIEKKLTSILHDKFPRLKDLAKEFLMSESTLQREFKQSFGKPIYEYYLEKKMELGKELLTKNDYTIAQVAYLLGYEASAAFIKAFKKRFGKSPGALRA